MCAQEETDTVAREQCDRQYSGYFNTSNAVTSAYGNNQASLAYADSLNQVKLDYSMLYRNIWGIQNTTSVGYYSPDGTSDYEGTKHYKQQSHSLSASYQRFQGNHLFDATLCGSLDRSIEQGFRTSTINHYSLTYAGNGMRALSCNSKVIALNLFYRYLLQHGRMVAINVVNTLGKSYSESEETMTVDATDAAAYDYDRLSRSDNNSYSLLALAYFTTQVKGGGKLTLSSRYQYKQLRQTSQGDKDKPFAHDEFLYADFVKHWEEVPHYGYATLSTMLGFNLHNQTTSTTSLVKALPYIRLHTDWRGKEKLQGATAQLTLTMESQAPQLSDMTAGITYFDPWLMATGTPDLKTFWRASAKLTLAYLQPNQRWTVQLVAIPSYSNDHIATAVMKSDGCVYLKPANMGGDFELSLHLRGTWHPTKWLTLEPYLQYYNTQYDTPVSSINFNHWRGGGTITISGKNLSVVLAANSPTKKRDSNLTTKGSAQYAAVVAYKIHNYTVGAEYHYSGHNEYITADTPNLYYLDNNNWQPMSHNIRLNLVYTFSKGHSRKHKTVPTVMPSPDTGLNRFNTPRKAD